MAAPRRTDGHRMILAALQHPLRRRILQILAERDEATTREVAEELGAPLAAVAYHVRVLDVCGALTPADEG